MQDYNDKFDLRKYKKDGTIYFEAWKLKYNFIKLFI
jgi:hypothetical protein